MALNEETEKLLNTLYTRSIEEEKRKALQNIIRAAMEERAAYTNGPFYDPLTFILTTSTISNTVNLNRLEKKIQKLEKEVKTSFP